MRKRLTFILSFVFLHFCFDFHFPFVIFTCLSQFSSHIVRLTVFISVRFLWYSFLILFAVLSQSLSVSFSLFVCLSVKFSHYFLFFHSSSLLLFFLSLSHPFNCISLCGSFSLSSHTFLLLASDFAFHSYFLRVVPCPCPCFWLHKFINFCLCFSFLVTSFFLLPVCFLGSWSNRTPRSPYLWVSCNWPSLQLTWSPRRSQLRLWWRHRVTRTPKDNIF